MSCLSKQVDKGGAFNYAGSKIYLFLLALFAQTFKSHQHFPILFKKVTRSVAYTYNYTYTYKPHAVWPTITLKRRCLDRFLPKSDHESDGLKLLWEVSYNYDDNKHFTKQFKWANSVQ